MCHESHIAKRYVLFTKHFHMPVFVGKDSLATGGQTRFPTFVYMQTLPQIWCLGNDNATCKRGGGEFPKGAYIQ